MRRSACLLLSILLGCQTAGPPPPDPAHDDPSLTALEERSVRLRTDLSPVEGEAMLGRLVTLETALANALPFVGSDPAATPPLTVVLGQPARFALRARDLGISPDASAFCVADGTVYLRYDPADWVDSWERGPPHPLEPRVRPLAKTLVTRRLLLRYGHGLEPTWLEEGLAQIYSDVAARETGDGGLVDRQLRDRLIDAYLPLYLGAPPALVRVVEANSLAPSRKRAAPAGDSPALAWAVVRFLLADPDRVPLLEQGLERAAGQLEPAAWESARQRLAALEPAFEADLRDATLRALLATFVDAQLPIDRWESVAALRLLANIDVYGKDDEERQRLEQSVELRRAYATKALEMMAEAPAPARFLEDPHLAAEIARVRGAANQRQAFAQLKKLVGEELARRSRGYGHQAIEDARAALSSRLEQAMNPDGT